MQIFQDLAKAALSYSLPYGDYNDIFCCILCWERKCAWVSHSATQHGAPSHLSQTPHQSLCREKKSSRKRDVYSDVIQMSNVQIKWYLGIAFASL